MFDISLSELFVIAVVALVVLGPEKATNVARQAGKLLGKLKQYANKMKQDFDLHIGETIEHIKHDVEQVKDWGHDLTSNIFHIENQDISKFNTPTKKIKKRRVKNPSSSKIGKQRLRGKNTKK